MTGKEEKSLCLRVYDGRRICVALRVGLGFAHLCGQAHYTQDPLLGGVLRLELDNHSVVLDAEILISEANWKGVILPGTEHGCEVCFIPAAAPESSQPLVQERF